MSGDANALAGVHLPAVFEPVYRPVCDSARAEGVRRAQAGAPEGTLVWAGAQEAAYGRRGRIWHSPAGGLYCALVLRADLPSPQPGELVPVGTVALGMAMAEQVAAMTELRYRWPDAVYVNAARVGGVWLDTGPDWQVLACAANVAQPPTGGFDCACLAEEGGNPALKASTLLEAYARHLLAWLTRWDEDGLAPVLRQLRSRTQRPGNPVTLDLPDGRMVSGGFQAIGDDGALELETDAGPVRIGLGEYLGLTSA